LPKSFRPMGRPQPMMCRTTI